jgi:hypothetical protein
MGCQDERRLSLREHSYFETRRPNWVRWAPEGGSAVQVTPQGERGTLDDSFVYGWSESVDRKFLYYVQNGALWRVDATEGEAFRILALGPGENAEYGVHSNVGGAFGGRGRTLGAARAA